MSATLLHTRANASCIQTEHKSESESEPSCFYVFVALFCFVWEVPYPPIHRRIITAACDTAKSQEVGGICSLFSMKALYPAQAAAVGELHTFGMGARGLGVLRAGDLTGWRY